MKRRQTWAITLVYVATFGSFVGYSAGLPLLMKTEFPKVGLSMAFLGPLVGALARPVGGMLADRMGGARLTFRTLIGMLLATSGLIVCLNNKSSPDVFPVFLGISVLLFLFSGLGNGAAYQMIPATLRAFHLKNVWGDGDEARYMALKRAKIETSAAVGFIGAVGAYGGWMIPQTFGLSISMTGAPFRALELIMGLYLVCLVVLWNGFLRPDQVAVNARLVEAEF